MPQYNTSSSTCIPNMTILACWVLQKPLTKNFINPSTERKNLGQIMRTISCRWLVPNATIQHIIIHLYTKYDYSSLLGLTETFDEKFHQSKYGKKESWTNNENNKLQMAGSQCHNTTHHHPPVYQI